MTATEKEPHPHMVPADQPVFGVKGEAGESPHMHEIGDILHADELVSAVTKAVEEFNKIEFIMLPVSATGKQDYLEMIRSYLGEFDVKNDLVEELLELQEKIYDYKYRMSHSALWAHFVWSYGDIVGFVVLNHQESNWSMQPRVYMEDLYIKPAHRSKGFGTKVIEWLKQEKERHNWFELYWTTEQSNKKAQSLYHKHASLRDNLVFRIGGEY